MRRSTRHASAAASASGSQTGEPATSPSELFASPELQVALLPMLHSLDHCRLSLTCTNLRSILNTPEFAARVVTDVGPVKELLARARAIITGEESSPDVWLWQPPANGDHLGGREPIERRSQDSIDDRWARGLIDMLEGNVDYLIVRDLRDQDGSDSESSDDSDWEGWDSSPLKLGGKGGRGGKGGLGGKGGGKGGRGRGRGDPPRSRAGTLARIAAMEAEPPLTWLRNVQTAMSRHYLGHEQGQVRTNQRFAWLHCVRYGLDGMLPQVLDARRKYEERMRRENPGRRRVAWKFVKVDAFITFPRRRRSFFGAITPWQIRRNPLMLGAYLGHPNVMATLVRLGATCEWEDDITFEAFLTALDHNRRDVVRCFCTPRAAGGCGLSLNALPRRKGRLRLTASPCEIVWRHLMDDVDRRQCVARAIHTPLTHALLFMRAVHLISAPISAPPPHAPGTSRRGLAPTLTPTSSRTTARAAVGGSVAGTFGSRPRRWCGCSLSAACHAASSFQRCPTSFWRGAPPPTTRAASTHARYRGRSGARSTCCTRARPSTTASSRTRRTCST